MGYSFTCPLEGCEHMIMTSHQETEDKAAEDLTSQAEKHLQDMHKDVHKTHDEVASDVRANMVKTG